ncbi:MAG: radical SAM protein [Candidatus Thermoplasmatota archaeon]
MTPIEGSCKSALSQSHLPGLQYALNPYRGCAHNCTYCYAPFVLKINRQQWHQEIYVKRNIPQILTQELKKKKPGVVGLSTVTDPYQPVEKKYQLTRQCLELLFDYDFPVCIQTKSPLVLRDITLLSRFSNVEIMISIGTEKDHERILLEPGSPSISDRLSTVRTCAEAGIKTSVFFGPIYPTISTERVESIIDLFIEHGASHIMIDSLHLRPELWETIKHSLEENEALLTVFSKYVLDIKNQYNAVKKQIQTYATKKKFEIVDAF